MSELTIALLQMTACGNDIAANQAKGTDFCRRAKLMGADLALFPEMWSVGYTPNVKIDMSGPDADLYRSPAIWAKADTRPSFPELVDVWRDLAIDRDHTYIRHFQSLAIELEMAIAITYLEKWAGLPRNSMSLIDRHGEIVLTYAKVHTCDFSLDDAALTPGERFSVATLDTAIGDVQVGAMICYDREFPESARVLMVQGAEIILVPNACDMNPHRLTQFRARAYENMVGVAMANTANPKCGHSTAYDGISFTKDGYRDTLVIEAGDREGVYPAIFNLEALREFRQLEAWGNSFRRPNRYAALTETTVAEPFIRVDHDGRPHDRDR